MSKINSEIALDWLRETMGSCSSDEAYVCGEYIIGLLGYMRVEIEQWKAPKQPINAWRN